MTLTAESDPLLLFANGIDPPKNPYSTLPADWAEKKLGDHLTVDQTEIYDALVDHRHVAVQSCNDVGKSFSAARLTSWWIDTHPLGQAFVVTTAPTAPQVSAIIWREIGRAHRAGNLPGRLTATCEWKVSMGGDGPDELVAYGRKPADYDPVAFTGIHQRYILVIIDEACGVPQAIFDAAETLATNEHARILAIGNPDDPSSYFREICEPTSGWHVIRIDALKSPNFTAEALTRVPKLAAYMQQEGIEPSDEETPEELRDLLISPIYVSERLQRWGANSPLFQSKVRGLFPSVTQDTLIHPHWVNLARQRELMPDPTDPRMGVDVARYGSDHSIILMRLGGHCRVLKDVAYGPITDMAGFVQEAGRGRIQTPIANIDDTGVGGGVTDILKEEMYPCLPLIAGGACSAGEVLENGRPKFVNARSEWWWRLRETLSGMSGNGSDGRLDLDPDDDELYAQLTVVKYKINRHGQIEVESKDSLRSRHIASPDRADALAMALVPSPPDESYAAENMMMTGDLMSLEF